MDARAIIARVRDGEGLDAESARWFANGLATGAVDDAQAGAFAMAVLLRGLGDEGRVALTKAMRDSGDVLTWDMPGPIVDKHSTGGVGDAVSLILAPALAACGAFVPMISGRGLGHTGGTLDKMEAIPGYRTDIDRAMLEKVLREAGCAIIGATGEIAPADRRLYGIRDVTSTVESVDLITASILSKKLAAGLDTLVLDVKCGSGAFMPTREKAQELAQALVQTANDAGCKTSALITDMNSPLARSAGNAVEVVEVIDHLLNPQAHMDTPLMQVTLALTVEALVLSGLADGGEDAQRRVADALTRGHVAERFARMVAALGGPMDLLERPQAYLTVAPQTPVPAQGYVQSIDTRAVGELVVHMGGGRLKSGDTIDSAVGLAGLTRVGEQVDDSGLGQICGDATEALAQQLRACYTLSSDVTDANPLILDRIPS